MSPGLYAQEMEAVVDSKKSMDNTVNFAIDSKFFLILIFCDATANNFPKSMFGGYWEWQ